MSVSSRTLPASLAMIAVVAAACSVPAYDSASEVPTAANACSSDGDCGDAVCGGGVCIATGTEIDPLVIEIVPPASSHFGAGDSFLVQLDDPSDRARSMARDIALSRYASVDARLVFSKEALGELALSGTECEAVMGADNSLGVHAEVTRAGRPSGLPVWSSVATAKKTDPGWEFQLSVPADTYDMYLTPLNGCALLPPVWLRVVLQPGKYVLPAITVPSLARLNGTVQEPAVALENWSIQLIEPSQGLRISTRQSLQSFELLYVPLGEGSVPLVRVAPPEGVVAPTVLWDLSVVDFDNDGVIGLDLSELKWSVTTIRARIERSGSSQGLSGAMVTLRSKRLADVPEGLTATWETSVKSGADGDFELQLVPGEYQVVVSPADASDAVTIDTWTVGAEPAVQHGRVVTVKAATRVTGIALEPRLQSPIARADFEVVPIAQLPSIWERALGTVVVAPRAGSGQTGDDGAFSVAVDAGKQALLIKTPEGSGYPWLIRSGMEVEDDTGPMWEMGGLHATYPVVVSGKLTDPDGNLMQLARLRAFALVGADGGVRREAKAAKGAIQVAETRSDDQGRFRLMLPASLR